MFVKHPKFILPFFILLSILGAFLAASRLEFEFDFEQFFPQGDKDLEFFLEFKEQFEPDDIYLLVALPKKDGVFDQPYLKRVLDFSLAARRLSIEAGPKAPGKRVWDDVSGDSINVVNPVVAAQSLLQIEYPVKNPFTGFTAIPALHLEDTSRYARDKERILNDERLVNNLISEDAKTLVVVLKTVDDLGQTGANQLITNVKRLLEEHEFEDYHLLGRTYFQTEIVRLQIREFILATIISIILVFLTMLVLFRRVWGIAIALISILVGLLIFIGVLGLFGRTLDTLALLYPIIMIIVATSDVVHVMSKYIDELQKGKPRFEAIQVTIREIGLSIFLTSTTTAIGFLSLVTSRLIPIRSFGINAAIGVMIAYGCVLIFTSTFLAIFHKDKIIRPQAKPSIFIGLMQWVQRITISHKKPILVGFVVLFAVCGWGMSLVSTNTQLLKILPKGQAVTKDFLFFESNFSGFRPFEIAINIQGDYTASDYEVVREMDKIETFFKQYEAVKSMSSITSLYKSINQAYNSNRQEAYAFPKDEKTFNSYRKFAKRLSSRDDFGVLVSRDKKQARISAKVLDVGANRITEIRKASEVWMAANIDPTIIQTRFTGTGIIIDKNSEYIRDSLLQGLLFAILLISIIVALIYKNLRMLIITLIPNVLPLMIAAAILGFSGTPLEGGVAIVFAIIFGIAVDDTIHLLSKFKLCKERGCDTEEAIGITLEETGKAICLTTIILFFGFLSLLVSVNPPAITIGILISSTLISALVCDLLIIPIMLRQWIK
ncbi:MAG: efflux RND transporter permease subunit [Aureispira sp.]